MIKVGSATETELKEKKARVEDALNATKAAVEEGIVPGGGVTLIRASSRALDKVETTDDDERIGIEILRRAVCEPLRQIAENAGYEGSLVVQEIKAKDKDTIGFDANALEYVDMFERGIIDPTKVVRSALQNAASVAGLMLTTECGIVEIPEPEKNPMPQMPEY